MTAGDTWRGRRPAMAVRRVPGGRCRRLVQAIRAIPGGELSTWRDVAVFLIGSAWGVMLTVGAVEAWRHLP